MDPEVTGTTTGYDDLASSIGAAMASSSTTPSLIRASSGVGSEELMASRSVSGGGSGADMRIVHSNIMIGSLPDDFDLWEDTTFMSTNTKTTTRL